MCGCLCSLDRCGELLLTLHRWVSKKQRGLAGVSHRRLRGPWLQTPGHSGSQREELRLKQAKKELISWENSGFFQTGGLCQLWEEVLGSVVCATTHPWPACLSTQLWRLQFPEIYRGRALGEGMGYEAWWRLEGEGEGGGRE